jgi:hypothetical protein
MMHEGSHSNVSINKQKLKHEPMNQYGMTQLVGETEENYEKPQSHKPVTKNKNKNKKNPEHFYYTDLFTEFRATLIEWS